jgi:hypothetical protein
LFSADRENDAAPGLEGGTMDVTLIWVCSNVVGRGISRIKRRPLKNMREDMEPWNK